ncbi:MAG: 3-dehydroquinate synthase, partial [Actinomycetota bacterium]
PHEVLVGRALSGRLAELVPIPADAELAFVVTHPVLEDQARRAAASLEQAGLRIHGATLQEGESAKSLSVAERLYDELAAAGAHRHDLVVAFGGGVVCDVAGFVASTYNRGMAVAHVPTTVLAQVDAAVGGKTALNLAKGKNLIGTFHQPCAVVCDVDLLQSLPRDELVSGLAEVVKYGLISDPSLLELVCSRGEDLLTADAALMTEVVERCVTIKASIVAEDEREHGRRAVLNYGHTFGHALEQVLGFTGIRHGEAVSLGMMAAAYLGQELGRLDDDAVQVHRRALEAVALPTVRSLDHDLLSEAWRRDKKYRRGVRFVLLRAIGDAEAGVEAHDDIVRRAVERLSE